MIVVFRQIGLSSVLETTYFLASPKGSSRHRLERLRVHHVGSATEEQRIHFSQQLPESDANLVMPVGHGPPTVLESAVPILVLSTGRLHDAVD